MRTRHQDGKHKPSIEIKPIYSKFTRNNLDTTERKNSQNIKTWNLKVENSPMNSRTPTTEFKLDLGNPSPIEALKITTVVEIMREKGKAKENAIKSRSKRETISKLISIAAKPHNNSANGSTNKDELKKLYRQPKLPSEEQKLSATKITSPLDIGFKDNLNIFEKKYGAQNNNVPHPYSFLAPSLALAAYNDTVASEVDDLNITPPKPIKRKTVTPKVEIRFPLSTTRSPNFFKVKSFNSKPELKTLGPRRFQSSSIPLAQETKNTTYINLEDHIKNLNEGKVERQTVPGYPSDIPPYNPDIIPYVEVPDYSDRREESLDKKDQLVANKKNKDYDDQDFVDPTAPLPAGKNKELDAVKESQKPKGRAQTPYVDIQDNKPIKDVDPKNLEAIPISAAEESDESLVDAQEPSEESKSKEELVEDVKPVKFDINDYKKPFNFKELFKELNLPIDDEDEDQKAEKEEKEEKEEAEGNYSEIYADPSQESSTTEETSFENSYDNENENENSTEAEKGDDDHTIEDLKSVIITEDEFKYGDRDFFKPFFGGKPKRSSHEFYYDGDKEENERREASNQKDVSAKRYGIDEEKLPPLSDILAKKDSFSRLSTNVEEDAKKRGKVPREYKNEWVLEYEFPKKKKEEGRT
ncbi:uncharacterized protein LOC117178447 [Belonocnema kinseyi]|uniref:uncharacterized protein LOC117178447 n=1 Tax=Belonocnema kinseyi TaxID=2817044 RepID=UPI00143D7E77|nr:uncharacterized protein LOC117178447 [Belonocnema kinseyi]